MSERKRSQPARGSARRFRGRQSAILKLGLAQGALLLFLLGHVSAAFHHHPGRVNGLVGSASDPSSLDAAAAAASWSSSLLCDEHCALCQWQQGQETADEALVRGQGGPWVAGVHLVLPEPAGALTLSSVRPRAPPCS